MITKQGTDMGTPEKSQSSSSNSMKWVKVYRLNDDGKWDEQATGNVTVDNLPGSEERGLFLTNEANGKSLLHRIMPDEIYTRPEDTIISWIELEDHTESALCFQGASECTYIWDRIRSVQTNLQSVFFKHNLAVASEYYRARAVAGIRPRGLGKEVHNRVKIGARRGNSDLLHLPAVRPRGLEKEVHQQEETGTRRGNSDLLRLPAVRPRGLGKEVHQQEETGTRRGNSDLLRLPAVRPRGLGKEVHQQEETGTRRGNSDLLRLPAVRPRGLGKEVHQREETGTRRGNSDLLRLPAVRPRGLGKEVHQREKIGTMQGTSDLLHPPAVRPTGLEKEVHQQVEIGTRRGNSSLSNLREPDLDLKLRLPEMPEPDLDKAGE